ncbi:hypothetical protein N2K17_01510 [Klebsiella michiganensis]|uniref:hypothetical protein n=1 Tax=Klebsiella michiganensis TaxID=1134687 RepID=UPI00224D5CCA|nr:hypothetical protein [Klebsiella michiganensis]MCX3078419.1 hypothetical protein [Klebsiella michiganensis]MCY0817710.1 hypothetical protein [Klebsiella michiganensis]
MISKGDKVKQVGGWQPGTGLGRIYDVVAGRGDKWLNMDGTLDACGFVCSDNEFFIIDEYGYIRYQRYPKDSLTEWQKVTD